MPTKVGRQEFNTALQHTDLDVRKAEQDPSLRSVLPAKANLNHDGKISGATEVDQLFTQIDSFGRNATAQDTSLLDPSGHGTQQARAMRALGQLTQNAEVTGWTASVNFDRADFSTITAPAGTPPGGQTMVAAAATLIRERKDNSGTHQPWYNLDPNHAPQAPVVATPSTPASNSTGAYTVKPGDTFTKIAKTQFGDGNRWRELQALNPGIDPRMLKVGMTLKLPS